MTGQYGVKTYFFIRKLNAIYMYEVIAWRSLYIQRLHQKKKTFSLVEYTWHIIESNLTLQKVGFKATCT